LSASQNARPRQGQGHQASAGDGFSGLVDENVSATQGHRNNNDTAASERPRAPARETAASESQSGRRTGIRPRSGHQSEETRHQAEAARQSSRDIAPIDTPLNDAIAAETPADALEIEAAVKTTVVTADVTIEADETTAPAETDETPPPAVAPVVSGIPIVAAAVAVQIEFAADTPASVIDSSDALTISNPAATIVAAPAETAASAIARVANDTADVQTGVTVEADTQVSTDIDAQTSDAIDGAPTTTTPTTASTTSATDAAVEADASTETTVQVEKAAGDAQLQAKATTELSVAAKAPDPSRPIETPKPDQIIASTETKPVQTRDEVRTTPEQSLQRQDARPADQRGAANDASAPRAERPAETEARPAQRPTQEQAPSVSARFEAATTEQPLPQPTGFGVSQTPPHLQNIAIQAAQLTAMPATGLTVPVNGLAVEIAANMQIGRNRFEIRLDPPELGRIDVRLDIDRQGQVTSHLIVEKSTTLDLLRRDAQQLERALQDAGLKTSDNGLQFSLRDQQQQSGRHDEGSGRNAQRLIVTDEETIPAETAGRSYGRMIGQRGGIDIRV
jgi:chemotaxis protein MotD